MCHHLTESTMWFASYVRAIHTRPTKNEELDGELVDSLRAEIDNLKKQLDALEAAWTCRMPFTPPSCSTPSIPTIGRTRLPRVRR